MAEVSYEVYVKQSGRWTIEQRYTNMERQVAIDDAKSMHDNPSVEAVKVVKETYNESDNSTVESTVFSTESIRATVAESGGGGGGGMGDFEVEIDDRPFADRGFGGDEEEEWDVPKAGKKKKKSAAGARPAGKNPIATIFMKILLITVVSLGLAFVMTYLYSEGIFG